MNEKVKLADRERAKRWREANPEKAKEVKKRHWLRHHAKNIQKSREKYQKHKTKRQQQARAKYHTRRMEQSHTRLKRLFGISQQQYDEMALKQNNLCAICNQPETMLDNKQLGVRKLAVDHCHITKKIRGLLCFNCNIGLGKFKDSIEMLQKAINYLIK